MNKFKLLPDEDYLFVTTLLISNRIETLLEREFSKFDITPKQWLLSLIIKEFFENPPTIKEIAKEMGSSHQNIKQVALKLEQKGLLTLEKDKKDARITRLKLTEYNYALLKKLKHEDTAFKEILFKNIDKNELRVAAKVLFGISVNVDKMYKNYED